MFDLLEDNSFVLPDRDGRSAALLPTVGLAIREKRLVFDVDTEAGEDAAEFHLSLSPFRQVVKDYWQICESYYDAVKKLPPSQIEAIDMARRGIHNEGARILRNGWRARRRSTTTRRDASSPSSASCISGLTVVTQDFPQSVCSAAITTQRGPPWPRG
jgi:uncharacterized protein (UPF0262 family)